ncbi:MAG: histidine kinase [Sphingobium sp.]|nr:MAG: histidine kinase [Sphingobium sp.]
MVEWTGTEAERAAVLATYDLGPERSEALNEITRFVAALCETPIALVSLVEEERQCFPSRVGLAAAETPRSASFCAHAMMKAPFLFVVPDARQDTRFADNPLVTGEPNIRFYAGAPLVSPEGVPLGALAVIDEKPREGLTPLQIQGLEMLSHRVVAVLEAQRRDRSWSDRHFADAQALSESEGRFRILADAMPQMVWSSLPDGTHDYFNARWYEFLGLAEWADDWREAFHPDDRDRIDARWRHSLDTGEPYDIEYRLRNADGEFRWVLARALPLRDGQGQILRWIGTGTDIHDQRMMTEERETIAHELSHRIKNIFSVIAGLIGLSTREHPEIGPATDELRERVLALGRAHDYVRPHSVQSTRELGHNSLKGVLEEIFSPYVAGGQPRVSIMGCDIEIDDRSATPLALLFHELATNAAKYGALSRAEGHITLAITNDGEECRLIWTETGGPMIAAHGPNSFGTHLIALSVERQLGGTIEREWRSEGLMVSLKIPLRSMNRNG